MVLALLLAQAQPGGEEVLDRVVAIVGDYPITYYQLMQVYSLYAPMLPPGVSQEEAMRKVLEDMVNNRLLYLAAKADTAIRVSDEEVEEALKRQLDTLKAQMGEEKFREELEKEGITEEDLKDEFREQVRVNLYIQKFVELRVKPQISVTEDEARAFYEEVKDSMATEPAQVKLAHVLIRIEPSAPAEQEAYSKAKRLVNMLLGGEDFTSLVQRFSDDRESAKRGGDLGWVPKSALPENIRKALEKLKPGQFTKKPLRGEMGYHIFQLLDATEDAFHLRHILVKVNPTPADSAKALRKAKRVLKLAKSGKKSFSQLAKVYSQDPQTKEIGGELGWLPENALTPEIAEAVKDAKPGDVVGPVLTPFGYSVIKVLDRKERVVHPFEEIKPQVMNYLFQKKVQDKLQEIVERQREKTYVEIKL